MFEPREASERTLASDTLLETRTILHRVEGTVLRGLRVHQRTRRHRRRRGSAGERRSASVRGAAFRGILRPRADVQVRRSVEHQRRFHPFGRTRVQEFLFLVGGEATRGADVSPRGDVRREFGLHLPR